MTRKILAAAAILAIALGIVLTVAGAAYSAPPRHRVTPGCVDRVEAHDHYRHTSRAQLEEALETTGLGHDTTALDPRTTVTTYADCRWTANECGRVTVVFLGDQVFAIMRSTPYALEIGACAA